jgi:hypothetical protein
VTENGEHKPKAIHLHWAVATAFLLLAIFVLAADAVLFTQNRDLKSEIDRLERVQVGSILTPLTGSAQDGAPLSIRFEGRKRQNLILLFSSLCAPCTANWPNWDSLLSAIAPTGSARVVAVNLGGTLPAGYVALHHLDRTTLLATPTAETVISDNFRVTPETILADAGGRVEGAWVGPLTPTARFEILRLLGPVNPGYQATPAGAVRGGDDPSDPTRPGASKGR